MSVNDVSIFALGLMAVLCMAATIAIFWIGLFALLSGRDIVWECSWSWPGRLLARWRALSEMSIIVSLRSAFVRFVDDQRVLQQASGSSRFRMVPNVRRPVSHHYLTVGARARMRAGTQEGRSPRRAA
jgi:membrane protein implicated in regulation of membrane protease activity